MFGDIHCIANKNEHFHRKIFWDDINGIVYLKNLITEKIFENELTLFFFSS